MNIVKLSTLKSDEVLRLTAYLEKFAKTEDKHLFVLSHLGNFFLKLNLEQSVALGDAISSKDTQAIDDFIKKYPDIDVNLDGDSKTEDIPGWKVKEESLEAITKLARNATRKTSKLKQIIRARELVCLENEDATNYDLEKISSKILEQYDNSKFVTYISRLKNIIPIKELLTKVFAYYRKTHAEYFVKYVFFYLDVIMLDTKQESNLTKEYIKTIKSIIK